MNHTVQLVFFSIQTWQICFLNDFDYFYDKIIWLHLNESLKG